MARTFSDDYNIETPKQLMPRQPINLLNTQRSVASVHLRKFDVADLIISLVAASCDAY